MKFRTSMIYATLLVFGLQLYAQQADSASPMMQYPCLGRPGRLHGAMSRACKSVLGGTQTPQPSNDLPRNDHSGTFITFDAPGAGPDAYEGTYAFDITPSGEISGDYTDASNVYHGFLRAHNGTITTFDAPGAGTDAYEGTYVSGINPWGAITGSYADTNNNYHGFLRQRDGAITTFDVPGGRH